MMKLFRALLGPQSGDYLMPRRFLFAIFLTPILARIPRLRGTAPKAVQIFEGGHFLGWLYTIGSSPHAHFRPAHNRDGTGKQHLWPGTYRYHWPASGGSLEGDFVVRPGVVL